MQAKQGRSVWLYIEDKNQDMSLVVEALGKFFPNTGWKQAIFGAMIPHSSETRLVALAIQDELVSGDKAPSLNVYRFEKPLTRREFDELYM